MERKEVRRILLQVALFITTFITTTIAGAEWAYSKSIFALSPDGDIILNTKYSLADFASGLGFSIPLLLILTVHEFGHYFVARYHKVKTSLPYYIPFPPLPLSIGTMGAVIRLRSRPKSNLEHFDIGLAGPLAGVIVAVIIMFYGFLTLPPQEKIFKIHPEYEKYGLNYADSVYTPEYLKEHKILDVQIGSNLLFWIFEHSVADAARVPNPHEMMHYPILLACYIALFFQCLNLLPIGQLDGGHVVYGLFGFRTHSVIASVFYVGLLFYSGLGLSYLSPALPKDELVVNASLYILFLYFCFSGFRKPMKDTIMYALLMFAAQFLLTQYVPRIEGGQGWFLFFAFLLGRFVGVFHPRSEIELPLDPKRVILGWITLLIFVLCFSSVPIIIQ
jgi:membrane-associated protease RseP (regulator of RpoE activity)